MQRHTNGLGLSLLLDLLPSPRVGQGWHLLLKGSTGRSTRKATKGSSCLHSSKRFTPVTRPKPKKHAL